MFALLTECNGAGNKEETGSMTGMSVCDVSAGTTRCNTVSVLCVYCVSAEDLRLTLSRMASNGKMSPISHLSPTPRDSLALAPCSPHVT